MNPDPTAPGPSHPRPSLLASAGDLVRYEAGNPNFRGRTSVEIRGDGQANIRFQQGQQSSAFQLRLDATQLAKWRELLDSHPPGALVSSRSVGQPDEVRVHFTILQGTTTQSTELWYNERWSNPSLHALIQAFTALATQASAGKIQF